MAKDKKKSKTRSQSNPERKTELDKIEKWIEAQNFDFKTKNQIKASIKQLNTENIIYLGHNLDYLTKDTFTPKIREILNEQNNKSQENQKEATGAKPMSDENNPTPENNNEDKDWRYTPEYNEYKTKYPDWADDYKKYQEYKKDNKAFDDKYKQQSDSSQPTTDEENHRGTIDESEPNTTPTPEPENTQDEPWDIKVEIYYKKTYNEGTVKSIPLEPGIYIEVDSQEKLINPNNPKEKQQLTGTAISYDSANHVKIQKTKEGVEPKDQSFKHFQDHIAALKELGNTEIALGKIQSSKFCTKVVAAALANGIDNITLKNDQKNHNLDFSAETLKEIPVENQTQLIEYAIKNDVKIEFGENSPLLDFNNETLKGLDEETKYQFLALLLKNPETKDKIQNIPTIELYAKDENGKIITEEVSEIIKDKDGKDKEIKFNRMKINEKIQPEDVEILRKQAKEQTEFQAEFETRKAERIAALKERIAKKEGEENADKTFEELNTQHQAVEKLRGRIKNGENRQEVLKEVKAETYGNNYFQYAHKHTQQKS